MFAKSLSQHRIRGEPLGVDAATPHVHALDAEGGREGATPSAIRAYVHHLFAANEGLAVTLCTLHNEHFFVSLAGAARRAIRDGGYPAFTASFLRRFGKV